MDLTYWFQVLVTLLAAIGGWFLNVLWHANTELTSKIQNIELLVAGQYVSRAEFQQFSTRLMDKLDRMEEKMEKKVDK